MNSTRSKVKFSIAHVGANKRFTNEDQCRLVHALSRLIHYDYEFAKLNADERIHHEIINLRYGDDYLKDHRVFEVVVLHSIFHPGDRFADVGGLKHVAVQLSPLHSLYKWREKLRSSGARYIGVCEGAPVTLNGWQIGDLDGYEIIERDRLFTLYHALEK